MFRRISLALILATSSPVQRSRSSTSTARSRPSGWARCTFEVSCPADVRADFNRGVALLHSFWYAAAIDAVQRHRQARAGRARWSTGASRWGSGATRSAARARRETITRGRVAVAREADGAATSRHASATTSRRSTRCTATRMRRRNRRARAAYEAKMAALYAAYPKDSEAAVFYAIALVAAASPTDQTYAKQMQAAGILEKVFATQPDHPGITHYLIHSYDYPKLADKGLAAARRYASIAPDAPHALHMPSHIFTRVGAWQDSIDSNMASAAAAKKANSRGRRAARDGLPGLREPAACARRRSEAAAGRDRSDPRPRRRRQRLRPRRLLSAPTRFPRVSRSSAAPGPRPPTSPSAPARSRTPKR